MSPLEHMTTALTGRSPWPFATAPEAGAKPESKTERMRAYLRDQGPATAATLADEADLPRTDLVSALLKGDMARGSVFRRGHKYHWNHQFDAQHQRLQEAERLLRSNGFTVLKDTAMSTAPAADAKCDCVTQCGDDPRLESGKVPACEHRARLQAENKQTEVLRWVNITPQTMPDAFELVLLECEAGGKPEPVAAGYWDGEYWMNDLSQMMTGKVTGWAAWPNGRQGGARHG